MGQPTLTPKSDRNAPMPAPNGFFSNSNGLLTFVSCLFIRAKASLLPCSFTMLGSRLMLLFASCRTITNSFSDVHRPTLGVDFHFRRFEEAGTSVALQLWDIAGNCVRALSLRSSPRAIRAR